MYTEDEVDYLLDVYKKASNKQQVLTELSSQLGKSRRSIIGKLSRLGVYEKKVYLTKRCLLYTSPSPRDVEESRMPSSA